MVKPGFGYHGVPAAGDVSTGYPPNVDVDIAFVARQKRFDRHGVDGGRFQGLTSEQCIDLYKGWMRSVHPEQCEDLGSDVAARWDACNILIRYLPCDGSVMIFRPRDSQNFEYRWWVHIFKSAFIYQRFIKACSSGDVHWEDMPSVGQSICCWSRENEEILNLMPEEETSMSSDEYADDDCSSDEDVDDDCSAASSKKTRKRFRKEGSEESEEVRQAKEFKRQWLRFLSQAPCDGEVEYEDGDANWPPNLRLRPQSGSDENSVISISSDEDCSESTRSSEERAAKRVKKEKKRAKRGSKRVKR